MVHFLCFPTFGFQCFACPTEFGYSVHTPKQSASSWVEETLWFGGELFEGVQLPLLQLLSSLMFPLTLFLLAIQSLVSLVCSLFCGGSTDSSLVQ